MSAGPENRPAGGFRPERGGMPQGPRNPITPQQPPSGEIPSRDVVPGRKEVIEVDPHPSREQSVGLPGVRRLSARATDGNTGTPEPSNSPRRIQEGDQPIQPVSSTENSGIPDKPRFVFPAEDDDWMMEPEPPRSPAEERDLAFLDRYVNAWDPQQPTEDASPREREEYTAYQEWKENLTPERRAEFDSDRQLSLDAANSNKDGYEAVKKQIQVDAPELLNGSLPADQAEQVSSPYALGFRQEACETLAEALETIDKTGGIASDVGSTAVGLGGQFLMTAPGDQRAEFFAVNGYYGMNVGKFVAAMPISGVSEGEAADLINLTDRDKLPADFVIGGKNGQEVVNPRYLAGFIDTGGKYHRNTEFGKSNSFVPAVPPVEDSDWL